MVRDSSTKMADATASAPDWDLEQLEVILDEPTSWQFVVAGPGAGKSAVACQRIACLIDEGVQPSRILLISFTRTAVAELRDRIVTYAVAGELARSVLISTIDSHAWKLRAGFEDEALPDPLKDDSTFDSNISRTVKLFRDQDPGLLDFMSRVEHLIIDEAQDVVGVRADLVIAILRSLSDQCGVTILADPAQAIYGFTDDESGETDAGETLLERLSAESPQAFVERHLKEIHRIQNDSLLNLFHRSRQTVQHPDGQETHIDQVISIIRDNSQEVMGSTTFNKIADLVSGLECDSLLVLFRQRAEVLMASAYCSSYGIQHRLRLSGLPPVVKPWIGWLFAEYDRATISRTEFDELWAKRSSIACAPFREEPRENAWALLHYLAAGTARGTVALDHLRNLLSRPRPPVEVCLPDLGLGGPVLGTIHASKGREAETVALMLPTTSNGLGSNMEPAVLEEGRVYYVGATRARDALLTARSPKVWAEQLDSGRVFKKLRTNGSKPPRAQMEIGRDGDVDRVAHLAWSTGIDVQKALADASLDMLPLRAESHPEEDYDWRLVLRSVSGERSSNGIEIGQMSKQFGSEIRALWTKLDTDRTFKPGDYIQHLYLFGVTTVALTESERDAVRKPFNDSGFALAPVVKGFPVLQFLFRKRKNKW